MKTKTKPLDIFIAYSHRDEELRDELVRHMSIFDRQGIVSTWYDRRITPGGNWRNEIDSHLKNAHIILLLISSDFLASDYCYDIEVKQAIKQHKNKQSRVIPIILRPVEWEGAPFSNLQALPKDGKPITTWENLDEAFLNVANGIRRVIDDVSGSSVGLFL